MKVQYLNIDLYEGLVMTNEVKEIDVNQVDASNIRVVMAQFFDDVSEVKEEILDMMVNEGEFNKTEFIVKGEESVDIFTWKQQ